MKTHEIDIPDYGKVVLKKLNHLEKSKLSGKILKISINTATGKEEQDINITEWQMWLPVYCIYSLPSHPNFYQLPESKKYDIVSYFGDGDKDPEELGAIIFKEAREFNSIFSADEVKKK